LIPLRDCCWPDQVFIPCSDCHKVLMLNQVQILALWLCDQFEIRRLFIIEQ
jgi:hypothetical protein